MLDNNFLSCKFILLYVLLVYTFENEETGGQNRNKKQAVDGKVVYIVLSRKIRFLNLCIFRNSMTECEQKENKFVLF